MNENKFYRSKCQRKLNTARNKLYNIESLLSEQVYVMKREGIKKGYEQKRRLRDNVVELIYSFSTDIRGKDYKQISTGIEEMAAGVSVLEKTAPRIREYGAATINTMNSYVRTLEKAIAEPENAEKKILSFIARNAGKNDSLAYKIAKETYKAGNKRTKRKILKAYSPNGVMNADIMRKFGIKKSDVRKMISNLQLKVVGYKEYKLV